VTETTSLKAGVEESNAPKGGGLAGLKLAQLQALASQLGITGGSRMRKSDLVTAISSHQRGGSVADRDAKAKAEPKVEAVAETKAKAPAKRGAKAPVKAAPAKAEVEAPAAPAAEEQAPRRGRSRRAESTGTVSAPAAAVETVEAAPAPAAAPPVAIVDPASQVRLHVNLGKKHGVTADDVRRLLGEDLGGDAASIGSVAMRDTYCHVRVPSSIADRIISAVSGTVHSDQTIKIELAHA
jgi:hypothetical protein